MRSLVLPVCLLLTGLAAPAVAGPADTPALRAAKAVQPDLDPDEKVALALLGQMAGDDAPRAARAERLFARLDDAVKLRPLTLALAVEPASLRIRAAQALGRIGDPRAVRPLLARVLREPAPRVRAALARAAGSLEVEGAVHTLARALGSSDEIVRRRAAEALGHLGDVQAIPYLLARWEARSGDFPRVYISQVRQLSYIQDYDVEVASTSFIADPIVGIAQPGVAMGVKILASSQEGTYAISAATLQSSLERLAGGRKARGVKGWRRWWDANGERLLRKAD